MARIYITTKCWHHTNPDYPCLIVQFEKGDRHFFHEQGNWMPKEVEIVDIIKGMLRIKPSLATMFSTAIRDGLRERWESSEKV